MSRSRRVHLATGTVQVTAIGMFGNGGGCAIAPPTLASLLLVVGGVSRQPRVVGERVEIRDVLDLTLTIDHNVVDGGAPRDSPRIFDSSCTPALCSSVIAVGEQDREDSTMTPRVRLTVCDAGPLAVDRSDLMVGESGPVTVPSTVVVIEHAQHGLILFDTGINHRVADQEGARSPSGVPSCGNVTGQRDSDERTP